MATVSPAMSGKVLKAGSLGFGNLGMREFKIKLLEDAEKCRHASF